VNTASEMAVIEVIRDDPTVMRKHGPTRPPSRGKTRPFILANRTRPSYDIDDQRLTVAPMFEGGRSRCERLHGLYLSVIQCYSVILP
jgi:hypothetical protein